MSDENELVYRIGYRIGQMQASGWPWQRRDMALLKEAQMDLLKASSLIRMQDDTIKALRHDARLSATGDESVR